MYPLFTSCVLICCTGGDRISHKRPYAFKILLGYPLNIFSPPKHILKCSHIDNKVENIMFHLRETLYKFRTEGTKSIF